MQHVQGAVGAMQLRSMQIDFAVLCYDAYLKSTANLMRERREMLGRLQQLLQSSAQRQRQATASAPANCAPAGGQTVGKSEGGQLAARDRSSSDEDDTLQPGSGHVSGSSQGAAAGDSRASGMSMDSGAPWLHGMMQHDAYAQVGSTPARPCWGLPAARLGALRQRCLQAAQACSATRMPRAHGTQACALPHARGGRLHARTLLVPPCASRYRARPARVQTPADAAHHPRGWYTLPSLPSPITACLPLATMHARAN